MSTALRFGMTEEAKLQPASLSKCSQREQLLDVEANEWEVPTAYCCSMENAPRKMRCACVCTG